MRFKSEEIAAFVILVCALLAVGALYLLSGASEPYSWSSADGDHVSVTGPVLSKASTYQGGHIVFTVKTDVGPLSVFVPASSAAFEAANRTKAGDEITVSGTVQTYKGQKEVVAEIVKAARK
ncbi:MAG TPA: OB-fold nucleic acid binding domain-containing protein [Methanocella sp.]|nr:OB-fold nucleic acid binding domain-containing protein [Methanocella sp.]